MSDRGLTPEEAFEFYQRQAARHTSDASTVRLKRLLPHYGGNLFIAVFNTPEQKSARARVVAEFGDSAVAVEVDSKMTSGLMEIFHHSPTRILRRFAWYCAFAAEREHALYIDPHPHKADEEVKCQRES